MVTIVTVAKTLVIIRL